MLASLVTPAGRRRVAFISGVYFSAYLATSGLVPTKLISPVKMFTSCGSSSSRHFLTIFPTGVILSSFSPEMPPNLVPKRMQFCISLCFPEITRNILWVSRLSLHV